MKLFINDFSLSCALGSSTTEVERNLFSSEYSAHTKTYRLVDGAETVIFPVPGELPLIPKRFNQYNSRNNALVLNSLLEIESEVRSLIDKFGKSRVGVVFGTSTSGIDEGINALRTTDRSLIDKNYSYALQELGSTSLFIKDYFNLKSVAYTISTACSSGARTFIEAASLLRNNICDAVIVGGADTLNDLTLNGFHSLEAISLTQSNPFSKNRSGINIGEGAGVFILSRQESEFELKGYGESSDAYHISSPDPNGSGAIKAMEMALETANLSPDMIDYVNLHGTGTIKNDAMEARAVSSLFDKVLASSTKPITGHTLGAAGAVELGFCLLSIAKQRVPKHFYDGQFDPEIPIVNLSQSLNQTVINNCMSNSYAFGGNNASIVLGKN